MPQKYNQKSPECGNLCRTNNLAFSKTTTTKSCKKKKKKLKEKEKRRGICWLKILRDRSTKFDVWALDPDSDRPKQKYYLCYNWEHMNTYGIFDSTKIMVNLFKLDDVIVVIFVLFSFVLRVFIKEIDAEEYG